MLSLLQAHPIFGLAKTETRTFLAGKSELVSFEPGALAIREGNPQGHVFVVSEGGLELYRRNREAKTQMLVGVLEPPALFGDAELYSNSRKWTVSARTLGPTRLIRIPNDVFNEAVEGDLKMAAALYKDACARHMLVINIMQIFALQKTQHKVLRLLWSASEPGPGGVRRTELSPTRVAAALGMDRKTVARNVAELTKRGLISRDGEDVLLHLPEELAFLAKLGKHGLGASWKLRRDG